MPAGGADVDWNVMLDPEDLARLTGQPREPATLPAELTELVTVAHAQASGLIIDDMIAEYRRTRIDG